MPWNELKPMGQRMLFIADHLKSSESMSALCALWSQSEDGQGVTHVSELVCYLCG